MKFLSKIFKRKKEETEVSIDDMNKMQKVVEIIAKEKPLGEENICEHCGMSIYRDQKVKTSQGKKYHLKPCFRELQKIAEKEMFK